MKTKFVPATLIAFFLVQSGFLPPVAAQNLPLRVMAANITSGNGQSYETPGIHIFQALKPDIVAIQEFRYNSSSASNSLRTLVDTAFGAEFSFYVEPSGNIPNGIVSRYPIVAAGSWDDPLVGDRGFAWAQIDLPGTTNDLYVVSVHLYSSGSAGDRNTEATVVKNQIQANFPANAWVVVGGDFNTDNRSEAAVGTFKTFLSDNPIPTDLVSGGNPNTSEPRSKPYDYLLPAFGLTNFLSNITLGAQTFNNGLVFDSDTYFNNYTLSAVAPVQLGDSHVTGMQHMSVMKAFLIPTNSIETTLPPVITAQPQSQTNSIGANVAFVVSVSGSAPLAYQWRWFGTNLPSATASNLVLNNIQPSHAGDYVVVITNSYGSITSAVATLTITTGPVITNQPQSLVVNAGDNATFTVGATGLAPLSYQWRFNAAPITGATNASYSRLNVQSSDAGDYDVLVSNATSSVLSDVAVLAINSSAAGVFAQWNFNSNPADASTTTGSTSPSVGTGTASVTGGITPSFVGGDTAADPAGSTDNTAWTTTAYPASGSGNKTAGVQFNVSTLGKQNITISWTSRASNTGSKYGRLQYSTDGVNFTDFAQAFTNAINFAASSNNLAALPGINNNPNFAFRLVAEFESTAINAGSAAYAGAGTSYAPAGTVRFDMVTVYGAALATGTAPAITSQPQNLIVNQGTNATFSVGATGTPAPTYQWRFNLLDIAGATAAVFVRSNVQPAHIGSYSVVVSNANGSVTSSNASLGLFIPAPVLTSPAAGVLQWQGLSNLSYTVETSTNLAPAIWTALGTATSPNTLLVFTNALATNVQQFYRVVYP